MPINAFASATATPVPLGRWLMTQSKRTDAVGLLAAAAASDPKFPRDGDYRLISARLNQIGADPEMHQALEEAELDWAAY